MESTMSKLSPLQRTKKDHGSKEALAKKVIGLLTKPEEEEQAAFEHRVNTMSNAKLLRLLDAHTKLASKFGSKDALVEKITQAKFKKSRKRIGIRCGRPLTRATSAMSKWSWMV